MPEYERKNLSRSNYEKEEDEITKNLQKLKKSRLQKQQQQQTKKLSNIAEVATTYKWQSAN